MTVNYTEVSDFSLVDSLRVRRMYVGASTNITFEWGIERKNNLDVTADSAG